MLSIHMHMHGLKLPLQALDLTLCLPQLACQLRVWQSTLVGQSQSMY